MQIFNVNDKSLLLSFSVLIIVIFMLFIFIYYDSNNISSHRILKLQKNLPVVLDDYQMKCKNWYTKLSKFKQHKNDNDSNNIELFYDRPKYKEVLSSLNENAKLELPNLIKFANEHYDMKSMIKTFNEKGYLIFEPKLDIEILDAAVNFTKSIDLNDPIAFQGPFKLGHRCSKFRKNCIHDRYDQKGVIGIANDYSIRAVIAALYNMNPYTYQTLNYPRSSLAAIHSDYIHFGSYPVNTMCAVWIALEDIHIDAGPLDIIILVHISYHI